MIQKQWSQHLHLFQDDHGSSEYININMKTELKENCILCFKELCFSESILIDEYILGLIKCLVPQVVSYNFKSRVVFVFKNTITYYL